MPEPFYARTNRRAITRRTCIHSRLGEPVIGDLSVPEVEQLQAIDFFQLPEPGVRDFEADENQRLQVLEALQFLEPARGVFRFTYQTKARLSEV
jgi:hypothetical protein